MSKANITQYADKADRAAQLMEVVLRASRGTDTVDVTLDAVTDDVSVTIKKASPFVLQCIYEQRDVLCFLLRVEGGGVKAVMV